MKLLKNQDLASKAFLTHIRDAKKLTTKKQYKDAWLKLGELNSWKLNDTENALADNLRGSILFKLNKFEKADKYFQRALTSTPVGSEINSQVRLNVATLFFKQEKHKKSWEMIETIPTETLYEGERKKYHLFRYKLARKLEAPKEGVRSLAQYFEPSKSYREVSENPISQHLIVSFSKLSQDDQISILNGTQEKNFAKVLLIQKYLNEYLYLSSGSEINDFLGELSGYTEDLDVDRIYKQFEEAKNGSQGFDNQSIGVVVPLSGKMARFGKSVLKGIDLALFDIYGDKKPKVYVQDSHGNGVAARLAVKKLIEKNKVSYIIGGVFTKTASEEYLEAKKYGTLFFSLSPIYLSFAEKNSLLFEVFGSIESQVAELLSDDNLEANGSNFVMIYPQSESGRAYYREVLRQAPLKNASLMDSIGFISDLNDYQDEVKKLLGVGYIKQYAEIDDEVEGELKGPRKVTYIPFSDPPLDPNDPDSKKDKKLELNFEWAYVPALPNDALQIIPSFRYFEARGLKYYGVPSWRTQTFLSRHIGLGNLFFVSSENSILQQRFSRLYYDRFKQKPGIVESMAYESVSLGRRLIDDKFNKRAQVVQYITTLKFLEGFSSSWHKEDGIWFKDMDTFKIQNRSIKKIY